ncbi:hypothetical protein SSTU70S_05580 [Stutzerimonas stutzeri]
MYWIAGTRPVLDGGVADNGMPFGAPTDEVERFVALVWLNTDEEDDGTYSFRFEAVDGWDTGSVTDYDHVTHFMECEAPAFPGEAAPAQEEQDGPLPDEQPSCRKCDGSVGFVCEDCAGSAQADLRPVVVTAPERIYLIVGGECLDNAEFADLDEVSWCADNIDGNGIEYRRATPAGAQAKPKLSAQLRESISEVAASILAQIAERKRAEANTTSAQDANHEQH